MMPGERDRGVVYVTVLIGSLDFRARGQRMITIDSCYNEAHDDLTFKVIGATMVY